MSCLSRLITLTVLLGLVTANSPLHGDGGRVCWTGQSAGYRLTVFSEPTPVRPGPVDLSLFVQDLATLQPITNAQATFALRSLQKDTPPLVVEASKQRATNRLFQAAHVDLPSAGSWQVKLSLSGPLGEADEIFRLEVAPPWPIFWEVAFWIFLPIVPITLFLLRKISRVHTTAC